MSRESIDALCEELTAEQAGDKKARGKQDKTEESASKQPSDRLTGKQVTAGLAILAALLLVFFLGMRWIDGRAETAGPMKSVPQTVSATTAPQAGRININTASLSELKELKGIGDKRAQAIIDYRNEYGPFTAIEEIMRIDGIGEAVFAGIKDDICV